jgi:penicillin-binding protein 1A
VIQGGTGRAAQIGEFAAGKTGTTENYGDAWFVGFNKDLTVAVWVGYPDQLRYMKTEYGGSPVAGGTYPAGIWQSFMLSWIGIRDRRAAEYGTDKEDDGSQGTPLPTAPATPEAPQVQSTTPENGKGDFKVPETQQRQTAKPKPAAPKQPAPTPQPAPQQPAAPAPPAAGGGGTGAAPGAAAPG